MLGVIYGGTRGTGTPTFSGQVKNFLPTAVNRDDLRILNYTKTVFCRGFAPDHSEGAHDAPHTP